MEVLELKSSGESGKGESIGLETGVDGKDKLLRRVHVNSWFNIAESLKLQLESSLTSFEHHIFHKYA